MTADPSMLAQVLDRPKAYHACLARMAGSVTAGVLLSQAIYWANRTRDPAGWFWKTQAEWEDETALSRREQETARRTLRGLGVLEEKQQGVPCRLFFRVNFERVAEILSGAARMAQSAIQDCREREEEISGWQPSVAPSAMLEDEPPPNQDGVFRHTGLAQSATPAWRLAPTSKEKTTHKTTNPPISPPCGPSARDISFQPQLVTKTLSQIDSHENAPLDPSLSLVVTAWGKLPEAIKSAILALAKAGEA